MVYEESNHYLEVALDAKQTQTNPLLQEWYEPTQLRANLADDLEEQIQRLHDQNLAEQFKKYCPVPGAEARDYHNQWVNLPDQQWVLAGIRFRGLDLNRPFVTIEASSVQLHQPTNLDGVAKLLEQTYSLFSPKHIRLFVPSHVDVDLGTLSNGAFWEQRYLAAPVAELKQMPLPSKFERIKIKAPKDLNFYSKYHNGYDELIKSRPKHREYATAETQDDLLEYMEKGGLYEVFVDDTWAGVIAGTRSKAEGLSGIRVREIFLDAGFRRQSLGSAVQRHLINQIYVETPSDTLFGTINKDNIAAIKTAEHCGRVDIGGFLWVNL